MEGLKEVESANSNDFTGEFSDKVKDVSLRASDIEIAPEIGADDAPGVDDGRAAGGGGESGAPSPVYVVPHVDIAPALDPQRAVRDADDDEEESWTIGI